MGQLWTLVQAYLDRQTFHVSERQLAGKLGYNSSSTFKGWREPKSLPNAQALARFSHLSGVPYQRILDSALADAGYLPEPALTTGPVGRSRETANVFTIKNVVRSGEGPRALSAAPDSIHDAAAADRDDHGEQSAVEEQGEGDTP